jgi:MraZ protein
MRFLGNIEAKTDAKGRAFLPASFRKVLAASGEESLVLRQDVFENLLVLYPVSVWNALMDDMRRRLSRWDRRQQMAYRTFVSSVVEVGIDGSGRILIPRSFLEAAGISQNVRFVGMGDTIEIWPADTMETMSKEDFGEVLSEVMKEEKDMKEENIKENKRKEETHD